MKFCVPLAKDILPQLASKATSSATDNLERKISGQGVIRAAKGFTLLILNEDMDGIVRIIKSLVN